MDKKTLEKLAIENRTPILVIDHNKIRKNYKKFVKNLPRVQAYYAVKANPEKEIIRTLYELGSSFDVASKPELRMVLDVLEPLLQRDEINLQDFIWDRIIYANPAKKPDSLQELNLHKPLLTYDSCEEMEKIKRLCPDAGLLLRIKVSNNGSLVNLSNKFGIDHEKAIDLIGKTISQGLSVEGLSFHVGSQCNNPENFIAGLNYSAEIFHKTDQRGYKIGEEVKRGYPMKILDIGGGFPIKYNGNEQSFEDLSKILNREFERLFPEDKVEIIAEPGRFFVGDAGTAVASVILAKNSNGISHYHLDDGLYHLYSAMVFDHISPRFKALKKGKAKECRLFGPTCDGFDELSLNQHIPNSGRVALPRLNEGDFVYAEKMGAYSNGSATSFNGFPVPTVVHINV